VTTPPLPPAPYLIVCDFDGTITVEDVTNLIWDAHLPYDWRNVLLPPSREGKLSALGLIARGYGDVRVPADVLLAEVRPRVRLRHGWRQLVAMCRARGWPLHVVSHGLDFYINDLLPPGVPVTCFDASFDGGRWCVGLPAGMEVAPGDDFKSRVVDELAARHPGHATIYIGDGRLDFPAARRSSLLLAVRGSVLARMCDAEGVPHSEFDDFDEVSALLGSR